MVIHQKSPVEDSLFKAAGGCPKLSTLVLLLGGTWYLGHKKGPGSLRTMTHKQNTPQGSTVEWLNLQPCTHTAEHLCLTSVFLGLGFLVCKKDLLRSCSAREALS